MNKQLEKALLEKRLPQALLFGGSDEAGKLENAYKLTAHLLQSSLERLKSGNHPDLHILRPEGKSAFYAIETIREMIDKVTRVPFEAPHQVFFLFDAERMQPAAANALLKTLEEPKGDTTLILLTAHPKELIPTILSRLSKYSFEADLEKVPPHLELFELLSKRLPYYALMGALEKLEKSLEDLEPLDRNQKIETIFSQIFIYFRDQHARQIGLGEEHLFYPEIPAMTNALAPLEEVEEALEEAKLALSRNMKLSLCLERLIGRLEEK